MEAMIPTEKFTLEMPESRPEPTTVGPTMPKMPIAPIVFGDKSHTDLHESLAVTLIIFTLTYFNRFARNLHQFWGPLAYIPNLQHGKSKSDKTQSSVKVQDEHKCLEVLFQSLKDLTKSNQDTVSYVMGRILSGRVWIHFLIGDVSGFNPWLGHYNSSSKLVRPYRDCHYSFFFMNRVRHRCTYVTLEEMQWAQCEKASAESEEGKNCVFRDISKHDIINAFCLLNMPLFNLIHGIYKISPP